VAQRFEVAVFAGELWGFLGTKKILLNLSK
jgi:hypothetical protein